MGVDQTCAIECERLGIYVSSRLKEKEEVVCKDVATGAKSLNFAF